MKLSEKEIRKISADLDDTSNRLTTLGELLTNSQSHACYSEFAVYGLGTMLIDIAELVYSAWEKLEGEDKLKNNE